MFVYVGFSRVTDDVTTYEFRGGSKDVKVNYFDANVVSIESESETLINELIESQDKKINCQIVSKEEFKELIKNSAQIERIRTIVKERITSKYSIADEIAIMKRENSDLKKVEYEIYIQECKLIGENLKKSIGY